MRKAPFHKGNSRVSITHQRNFTLTFFSNITPVYFQSRHGGDEREEGGGVMWQRGHGGNGESGVGQLQLILLSVFALKSVDSNTCWEAIRECTHTHIHTYWKKHLAFFKTLDFVFAD